MWVWTTKASFFFLLFFCFCYYHCSLEQVAQSTCGCPTPRGIQGQMEWGPEQPGLAYRNQSKGFEIGHL